MTVGDLIRLKAQIAVLKEIALDYPGKTIENIIQQMESRAKEDRKSSYKILLTEYLEKRLKPLVGINKFYPEKFVLSQLLETITHLSSNETILAKLNMMANADKKNKEYLLAFEKNTNTPVYVEDYKAEVEVGNECLDYLRKEGKV